MMLIQNIIPIFVMHHSVWTRKYSWVRLCNMIKHSTGNGNAVTDIEHRLNFELTVGTRYLTLWGALLSVVWDAYCEDGGENLAFYIISLQCSSVASIACVMVSGRPASRCRCVKI